MKEFFMAHRTYVRVFAIFDESGDISPMSLQLRGRTYAIDRVLGKRYAFATKAGGQGMRYTIRIGEQQTYLFQDEYQRWFVEEKEHVQ